MLQLIILAAVPVANRWMVELIPGYLEPLCFQPRPWPLPTTLDFDAPNRCDTLRRQSNATLALLRKASYCDIPYIVSDPPPFRLEIVLNL